MRSKRGWIRGVGTCARRRSGRRARRKGDGRGRQTESGRRLAPGGRVSGGEPAQSSARFFEYFIDVSPALEPKVGRRLPPGGPGYARLETALHAAQELAEQHHVPTIYVQHESILVRPYSSGLNLP